MEPRLLLSSVLFAPPENIAVANGPTDVQVADLGNGHADLVVVSRSALSIVMGNGDGTFQPAISYPLNGGAESACVGDLGNGHPDIVVGYFEGDSVSLFLGNGDGTFMPARQIIVGSAPLNCAIADLGNGHPDLLVSNSGSSSLSVLLGNGDGTFQAPQTYATPQHPGELTVADLGNGRPDVVVTENFGSSEISVFPCDGDGALGQRTDISAGYPSSVAVADLGNGHPDLVVANDIAGSVATYLGDGSGNFQPPRLYSTGLSFANKAVVANFGDGEPDVVVATQAIVGGPNSIQILSTDTEGDLALQQTLPAGSPFGLAVADLGNGRNDIIFANFESDTVTVLLQVPLATITTLSSSENPSLIGSPPALSATVTGTNSIPTGGVTFFDGQRSLGTAKLIDGVATLVNPALSAGEHDLTASYSGDLANLGSGSASIVQSVITVFPTLRQTSSTTVAGVAETLDDRIVLTAGSEFTRGIVTAVIFLSPEGVLDDNAVTVGVIRERVAIGGYHHLSRERSLALHVVLPASLSAPGGVTYDVAIRLTDTNGLAAIVDSNQTLTVDPPLVDLTGSFLKVVQMSGRLFTVSFEITNSVLADIPAIGVVPMNILSSADGRLSDAVVLMSTTRKLRLRPGHSTKMTIELTIAGPQFLLVHLDPGNEVFRDDDNFANEVFVTTRRFGRS